MLSSYVSFSFIIGLAKGVRPLFFLCCSYYREKKMIYWRISKLCREAARCGKSTSLLNELD